jgi:hypothetical protein
LGIIGFMSDRRLPVPTEPPQPRKEPPSNTAAGRRRDSTFDAQLLGQPGQKRGLRGGPEVLDHARAAYLETEYSGPDDRRPPKGLLRKTEI